MLDWFRNLEPEFLILFGAAFVTLILLVVVIIRSARIHALIGKRALDLSEDLLVRDNEEIVEIVMSNTSYIDIRTRTVGILYKKTLLPITEEDTIIFARDSYRLSITLSMLRKFVIGDQKKIKKIYVYAEDSLARRTIKKAKNSYRRLKSILKAEIKAEKLAAKKVRYETGKYRFNERVGLVIKAIFSPLSSLFRIIRQGINRKLKNREFKLELKKESRQLKREMLHVEDEKRNQEMREKHEEELRLERIRLEEERQKLEKEHQERVRLEEERIKAEKELLAAEKEKIEDKEIID
ncbi:MAG: hypothetical protein WCY22_01505 [Acholeplasmataceae bacterium]